VALHLLPGVAVAAIFYLLAPSAIAAGYPAIAAAIVAGALGVVGWQLGWLLYQARRHSGRWSLSAVLPYRPGPWTWRKTLLVPVLVAWAIPAAMITGGVKSMLGETLFSWMPAWAINPLPADIAATTSGTARLVIGLGFLTILVILGPLTEELYFRGYLLPRLGRFGAWAPLLNVSLFALYHLWKPWDVFTVTVTLLPMGYVVWRTRDIRIGIATHIGINGGLGFLLNVLPRLLAA
jgi:membrane protease YdiL (CAAX protease family)